MIVFQYFRTSPTFGMAFFILVWTTSNFVNRMTVMIFREAEGADHRRDEDNLPRVSCCRRKSGIGVDAFHADHRDEEPRKPAIHP
jgi:hypothetical protein